MRKRENQSRRWLVLYSIACRIVKTTLRQSNVIIPCHSTTKEETSVSQPEQVRLLLGCHITHQEDFTIQLKNITQGERTWKHKDQWNCTWNGYTKTLTLSFTWVDAKEELWSLKFVANGHFKAGNFLDKVYQLPSMLTRMNLSMEKLNHEYKEVIVGRSDTNEGWMLKESHTYEKRPT